MGKTIEVWVRNKVAKADSTVYVCGNADFSLHFDFDETWAAHTTKTARFVCDDDTYKDVIFDGDTCAMPVLSNTHKVRVGVFAGNLYTTTQALISAKKSILCIFGVPAAPSDDVYNQIMEKLNGVTNGIGDAVRKFIEENPIGSNTDISVTETAEGVEIAITDDEGTKSYIIHHGKDGYTPVKGIDYVDGKDGYTPVKGVDYSDGKPGDPGYTPVKGKDYWTTADKAEMVSAVLSALPVYTGEVADA